MRAGMFAATALAALFAAAGCGDKGKGPEQETMPPPVGAFLATIDGQRALKFYAADAAGADTLFLTDVMNFVAKRTGAPPFTPDIAEAPARMRDRYGRKGAGGVRIGRQVEGVPAPTDIYVLCDRPVAGGAPELEEAAAKINLVCSLKPE